MKKALLAVGAIGSMVFAAACSSGGGGGAHGSFSAGTYTVSGAAYTKDVCGLQALGDDPTAFDATGLTVTITGNTMDFGGITLTGGGATWVFSTSQTGALSSTCNATIAQTDKLAANGTDKGTFSVDVKVSQASGSTNCSGQVVPIPCESTIQANAVKTGP